MDVKEFILQQFSAVRSQCDATMQGVTDEQFNWPPPGVANPISVTYLHNLAGEDLFIQMLIQGKPWVWEVEGWAEKIGLAALPGGGQGWVEARSEHLAVAPALAYEQALRAATDAYLATLTAEELDRPINLFGAQRPVAAALTMLIVHTLGHAGEIAALKGVQGIKGLPF